MEDEEGLFPVQFPDEEMAEQAMRATEGFSPGGIEVVDGRWVQVSTERQHDYLRGFQQCLAVMVRLANDHNRAKAMLN